MSRFGAGWWPERGLANTVCCWQRPPQTGEEIAEAVAHRAAAPDDGLGFVDQVDEGLDRDPGVVPERHGVADVDRRVGWVAKLADYISDDGSDVLRWRTLSGQRLL